MTGGLQRTPPEQQLVSDQRRSAEETQRTREPPRTPPEQEVPASASEAPRGAARSLASADGQNAATSSTRRTPATYAEVAASPGPSPGEIERQKRLIADARKRQSELIGLLARKGANTATEYQLRKAMRDGFAAFSATMGVHNSLLSPKEKDSLTERHSAQLNKALDRVRRINPQVTTLQEALQLLPVPVTLPSGREEAATASDAASATPISAPSEARLRGPEHSSAAATAPGHGATDGDPPAERDGGDQENESEERASPQTAEDRRATSEETAGDTPTGGRVGAAADGGEIERQPRVHAARGGAAVATDPAHETEQVAPQEMAGGSRHGAGSTATVSGGDTIEHEQQRPEEENSHETDTAQGGTGTRRRRKRKRARQGGRGAARERVTAPPGPQGGGGAAPNILTGFGSGNYGGNPYWHNQWQPHAGVPFTWSGFGPLGSIGQAWTPPSTGQRPPAGAQPNAGGPAALGAGTVFGQHMFAPPQGGSQRANGGYSATAPNHQRSDMQTRGPISGTTATPNSGASAGHGTATVTLLGWPDEREDDPVGGVLPGLPAHEINWQERTGYGTMAVCVAFPKTWEIPPPAILDQHFPRVDFEQMFARKCLRGFDGTAQDYAAFKTSYYVNVHVQPRPFSVKCDVLDGLVGEDVRQALFFGLNNSPQDYLIRIQRLEERFGHARVLHRGMMERLEAFGQSAPGDAAALEAFVFCLQGYLAACKESDRNSELLFDTLRRGIPQTVLSQFNLAVREGRARNNTVSLGRWLDRLRLANTDTAEQRGAAAEVSGESTTTMDISLVSAGRSGYQKKGKTNYPPRPCFYCPQGGHDLFRCGKFFALTALEKKAAVRKHNGCESCLRLGHRLDKCPAPGTCRFDGCGEKHHSWLHLLDESLVHLAAVPSAAEDSESVETPGLREGEEVDLLNASFEEEDRTGRTGREGEEDEASVSLVSFGLETPDAVFQGAAADSVGAAQMAPQESVPVRLNVSLLVLPVRVRSADGSRVVANCLFDTGSNSHALDTRLAGRLNFRAEDVTSYSVCVGGGYVHTYQSPRGRVWVSAMDRDEEYELPVRVYDAPVGNYLPTDWHEAKMEFEHLASLPTHPMAPGDPVTMIVGTKNMELLFHSDADVRRGPPGAPIAVRTALGWAIAGRAAQRERNHTSDVSLAQWTVRAGGDVLRDPERTQNAEPPVRWDSSRIRQILLEGQERLATREEEAEDSVVAALGPTASRSD